MNPIIEPNTIYLIEMLDTAIYTLIFFGILAFVASLTFAWQHDELADKLSRYPDSDSKNAVIGKGMKTRIRMAIVSGIVCLIFAVGIIFTPSTGTGYKMLLAKYATPNNIEKVKKEIINIKDGVKQDVIDIIQSTKDSTK